MTSGRILYPAALVLPGAALQEKAMLPASRFPGVLLLAGLAIGQCQAQSTLATIVGTVRDQSGGSIPGAVVTLRQGEQGLTRSVVSNDRGDYEVTQLPEGTYSLQAEHPGFKRYANSEIRLLARQVLRIDISLTVGDITDKVNVTGEMPVVNSESVTIAGGMQDKLLREFHTYTSNAYSPHLLALLMLPGSVHLGNANFKLGGARGNMYESKVDGTQMNHNEGSPSVLSVKEMNVV